MPLKTKSAKVHVPVVPLFIAHWYEENKDDLDFAIWEACRDYKDSPVGKWIEGTDGAIPTLVKMGIVGYECEEGGYAVKILDGRYITNSIIHLLEGMVTKFEYSYTSDPLKADLFIDEDMAQLVTNRLPREAEVLTLKELREAN